MDQRIPLCRELLKVTRKTVHAAEAAAKEPRAAGAIVYASQLEYFLPFVKRVIAQTQRRVLHNE